MDARKNLSTAIRLLKARIAEHAKDCVSFLDERYGDSDFYDDGKWNQWRKEMRSPEKAAEEYLLRFSVEAEDPYADTAFDAGMLLGLQAARDLLLHLKNPSSSNRNIVEQMDDERQREKEQDQEDSDNGIYGP